MNNPSGVALCSYYGDSYMELKKELRLRTTFCEQDSSNESCVVGVISHYCHVLQRYNDNELRSLITVVQKGENKTGCREDTYKEIQIHGEVRLNRDIEAFVVKKRFMLNPGIHEFVKKNNISKLRWID